MVFRKIRPVKSVSHCGQHGLDQLLMPPKSHISYIHFHDLDIYMFIYRAYHPLKRGPTKSCVL
jgi:hypothetical protein